MRYHLIIIILMPGDLKWIKSYLIGAKFEHIKIYIYDKLPWDETESHEE